jgi:coenzyme F420-reducing hydrogenase delta subunit
MLEIIPLMVEGVNNTNCSSNDFKKFIEKINELKDQYNKLKEENKE